MRTSIKKWGNSASLRIPATIMRAAKLEIDQDIDIREEDGRIVIEAIRPARRRKYELASLLAGITPENLHEETDWGPPVGKEFW
jgi:antitoxin MazE